MDDNQVVINAAEIEAWHLRDVTARNYIFATLTKAMKQNLYSCETAAAMWTRLDTQYQLRAAENLHLLWQSFYDFTHHVGTLTQCKMIIPRLYLTSSLSLDDHTYSKANKRFGQAERTWSTFRRDAVGDEGSSHPSRKIQSCQVGLGQCTSQRTNNRQSPSTIEIRRKSPQVI